MICALGLNRNIPNVVGITIWGHGHWCAISVKLIVSNLLI